MRPVYQSRTGEDGRCMSACVASILELPEAAVPDFLDGDQAKLVNQFTHKHGLHYRRVPLSQPPDGWHTVEGISPRGGMHAIIGRDGRHAFDPHYPDGTGNGIVEPMYYGEFMPLDKYRAGLHRALDAALDAQIEHNGYTCMRMPDSYTWTAMAPGKKTIQASSLEQLKRFINNAKPIEYFGNAK